ncbi:MAG: 3-hydroxybutyryl-CoA dehydrogenase [Burkholderiales bacterium]|nr:3-hydroxybutyryl-CoA dehydrogenase [Burkholderiales bacterium]
MGRGIAIAFSWGGHEVDLVDLKPRAAAAATRLADDARAEIASSLATLAELGAMPADAIERLLARIRFVAEPGASEALAAADVVFEAVPETLDAKRDAFARLSRDCRPDAILASTTSTILVTDLVPMVDDARRLLNAHWLNPAYVIPLVELSTHPGCDPAVVARLRALLEDVGKVPVVCGPAPGYIVPRLQALMMNEAARMVDEGVATAEEIDRATRYGLGLRFAAIGVVEFIDFGGNDILYHASRYLAATLSPERYNAPAVVDRMMREGRNGLRDGRGFHDYRDVDVAAYRKDVLSRTLAMLRHAGLQRPPR